MITEKQLELLSYINLIFNTRGEIPTYTDMLKLTGLSSKAAIAQRIYGLVKKGYLEKTKLGTGNLIITEKGKINNKVFRLCPMCGNLTDKLK
jgi:SOS-response transcriptional repressor LexA